MARQSSCLSATRLAQLVGNVYPRALAGSWDNTGLLLESPFTRKPQESTQKTKVLLCIDLTTAVCDEALNIDGCAHIIAYHPIIFSGLKSLRMSNSQQRTLLRLASAGISVYSPHTSVDAVRGGVGDMLANSLQNAANSRVQRCIEPSKVKLPEPFTNTGMGRYTELEKPVTLESAVSSIKQILNLKQIQIARSPKPRQAGGMIHSAVFCAGSGGSVLKGCDADLVFTGELSHHEQLAFMENGTHIILCGHAESERPFLPIMKRQLEEEFHAREESNVAFVISSEDKSFLLPA